MVKQKPKPKHNTRLLCNGTDGLIGKATEAADLANLEKALASKPLHPPVRKRKAEQ